MDASMTVLVVPSTIRTGAETGGLVKENCNHVFCLDSQGFFMVQQPGGLLLAGVAVMMRHSCRKCTEFITFFAGSFCTFQTIDAAVPLGRLHVTDLQTLA